MDAFGKEYHPWILAESVSQCSIKFEMQSVMACLKEIFNWETTIFHLKRLDTNYCQVHDWKKFVHSSMIYQTFFWKSRNIVYQILCSNALKRKELESLYFLEGTQIGMLYK